MPLNKFSTVTHSSEDARSDSVVAVQAIPWLSARHDAADLIFVLWPAQNVGHQGVLLHLTTRKKPTADSHKAELAHLPPVNNLTSRLSTLLLAPHALFAHLPQRCGDFLAGVFIIHPGDHPAAGLYEKNAGHPMFNHEFTFTGERPRRELNKSPSISKRAEEMIANVLKHLIAKVFQQD